MARGWQSTFTHGDIVWGVYQGTAAEPYQVAAHLSGTPVRCSCPSSRVPCKHARDLLGQSGTAQQADPPDWLVDWIARRKVRAAPADPERAAAGQRKRAERREQRITAGIEELERWLRDLVRGGLAEVPGRPRGSFDQMAARLVDAQAPGLARQVRELAYLPHSGDRWPERMLVVLGRLQLLLDAWRRLDVLAPDVQAELRAQVGISEARETVLAGPVVTDTWSVLGRRRMIDERFQMQRTWLWGEQTRRWALVLDFAGGSEPLPNRLTPGSRWRVDLQFYSGTFPLRALSGESAEHAGQIERVPAAAMDASLVAYARGLSANPWLERFPMVLADVVPRGAEADWSVVDAERRCLRLAGTHGWRLLAISGGRPIHVVGEWDGYAVHPLAAVAEGRFSALPSLAA